MCNEHVGNVYQYCDSVIGEKTIAACVHWITMRSTLRGRVLLVRNYNAAMLAVLAILVTVQLGWYSSTATTTGRLGSPITSSSSTDIATGAHALRRRSFHFPHRLTPGSHRLAAGAGLAGVQPG